MRHHKPRFDKEPNKLCVSARNGGQIPQKDDTPSMQNPKYDIRLRLLPFPLKRFGEAKGLNSHKTSTSTLSLQMGLLALRACRSIPCSRTKTCVVQKRYTFISKMLACRSLFLLLRGQGLPSYKHLLYFQIPIVDRPASIIRDIHHGDSLS